MHISSIICLTTGKMETLNPFTAIPPKNQPASRRGPDWEEDMMVERAVGRGHSSASPLKCLMACVAVSAVSAILWAAPASAQDKVIVGLITKTNTNPFFAKMKEGAEAEANKLGLELQSFAGKYDAD